MQNSIQWLQKISNTKSFTKCQWLHGENKTVQEHALNLIKKYFTNYDIQTIILSSNNDWQETAIALQHIDIFSPQKIAIIRLHSSKLAKTQADNLAAICQTIGPQQQIFFFSDSIDKRQLKSKWLQPIIKNIDFVTTNQLKPAEQNLWVKLFAAENNLKLSSDSIKYLCSLTYGNSDDCCQCLQQLAMIYSDEIINNSHIDTILSQQSNFQYYELSDALLSGNTKLMETIINRFLNGKCEKALLLWSVKQITLQLHQFQFDISNGKSTQQVLASIWSSKKPLYNSALNRISYQKLHTILQATLNLDKSLKGSNNNDFWQLFNLICNSICNGNTRLLENYNG